MISREDIRLNYTFERSLGPGNLGTVRIAHKTLMGHFNEFAVNSIKRERISESKMDTELAK